MKNIESLNLLEMKLVAVYEQLGDCEVIEHSACDGAGFGQFDIDGSDSWTAESKTELMAEVIYTLNEWFNDIDITEVINAETMDCVGDYLPLFLALPNDTTVLAVGNGIIVAPNTTTAYVHTDLDNYKYLAIYDYDEHEDGKDIKAELEQLFPSTAPIWDVTFKHSNSDYDYTVQVSHREKSGALRSALDDYTNNCKWQYMGFESVQIEEHTDTEMYYCDTCGCFYSGGGIWCTVYQMSGDKSDTYYGIDNTFDDCDGMFKYSHKVDRGERCVDEYGFFNGKPITISEMTSEEKTIFFKMKLKESETIHLRGAI